MSETDPIEPLAAFCLEHDLPWDEARRARFGEYLDLLEQFNASMNLIGDLSRGQIVRDLLIDSVAPAAVRRPTGTVLDVGTGAGLPGIPLKILVPAVSLTLVEPRRKRSTFLRIAANRLDLEEVEIERSRIEEIPARPYDYVVSKAFRPPDAWLEVAAAFTETGGVAICLTSREDRGLVDAGAEAHGFEIVASVDVGSELGVEGRAAAERCVVVLEAREC